MMGRQQVLGDLVTQYHWRKGAELGVYQGATYFYLLSRFPELELIGVDNWAMVAGPAPNRETGEASYGDKPMGLYETICYRQAAGYGSRARLIKGQTADVASKIDMHSLDFVFIDADHQTASVLADIDAWLSRVKPGGAMTGHDSNWPSVRRALDQRFKHWSELTANVWISWVPDV